MKMLAVAALAGLLLAGCDGAASQAPRSVSDAADDGTVDPGPRGEVLITAVDAEGEPVQSAQVIPVSLDVDGPAFGEMGRPTNADGIHRISVTPGNYRFSVHCGVESEPQDVSVAVDETVELDFTLDVKGAHCGGG